jgi:hypothetical protein
MSLSLLLVILILATGRITRLITADDFPPLLWARRRIVGLRMDHQVRVPSGGRWDGYLSPQLNHWWLGELVTCAWCASGWVSLGLWLGTWWFVPLPLPLLWWPATWGGGAILAAKLG